VKENFFDLLMKGVEKSRWNLDSNPEGRWERGGVTSWLADILKMAVLMITVGNRHI